LTGGSSSDWSATVATRVARCGQVRPGQVKEGAGRMVGVLITSTGVYLILALVFLVIIGGGAILAYRMSNRDP